MHIKIKSVFFILIALTILQGCKTDDEKIISHLDKGNAYFVAEQFKEAEIEYRNVIQINPGHLEAWSRLSETMMKLGDPRSAFQAYLKVETLDPGNPEALIKLAGFFLLGKKPDKAKEKLDILLEKEPENIEALFLKAQMFTQKKDLEQSEPLYDKILALDPDNVKALHGLARIKNFHKKFNEAEALLLKAIASAGNDVQPRLALVSYYISKKQFTDAENQLLTAAEENPENSNLQIILGNFFFRMRQEKSAEDAYLKAIQLAPNAVKPYMTAANFYDITGREDEALGMYKQAMAIAPDNLSVKTATARFQYKNKNIEAAETLIAEALDARPKFGPARMLKSEILAYKNAFDQALAILVELKKEEPKAPRTHYFMALCQTRLNRNEQAKSSAMKAVELNPNYTNARLLLADIHYQERSYGLAQEQAQTVLKRNPSDYRAVLISANAHMGTGDLEPAEKGFQTLINIDPNNPVGYYRMGLLKSYQKKYDQAEPSLNKALEINPLLMDVFTLIVRNSIAQNKYTIAHQRCEKQLELTQDKPNLVCVIHNLEASVFTAEKKMDKAKESLNKAMEANPDFPQSYLSIARIYLAEKDQENAIAIYRALIEKQPKMELPHIMLGTIFDSRKQYDKAADQYRKALAINPDFAPAANNLAYHLAERTDQFDEALKYARIAKSKLPNDPGIMDTLGLVYYKKGLYGNAISEFLDSIELIPKNPIIHFHLGLAYDGKGEKELAQNALKHALQLDSQFEGAEKAKEVLKEIEVSAFTNPE
ncbi:MAG: tetratricopeptide repeat protein [Desulfobacterium sp.]|nr:tetratricopeptide repeat protein [Desulfobacterium sp.]